MTATIASAFMKYDRKGLDCTIEFAPKLTKEECKRMRAKRAVSSTLCWTGRK